MEDPTLAVRIQLLLGQNSYLLLNSDIINLVWKADEGETGSIILLPIVLRGFIITLIFVVLAYVGAQRIMFLGKLLC